MPLFVGATWRGGLYHGATFCAGQVYHCLLHCHGQSWFGLWRSRVGHRAAAVGELLFAHHLFGAEFTQEFADAFGQQVHPKAYAVRVELREIPHAETDEAQATGRPHATGRWRS